MKSKSTIKRTFIRATAFVAMVVAAVVAPAQTDSSNQSALTRSMGITQHLGTMVPKDVPLKNDNGKAIHFGDMLQGRPVVLIPIFYKCESGCSLLVEQVIQTLAKANKGANKLVVGRDFDIAMVSIDPTENSDIARAKKQFFLDAYEPPHPNPTWRLNTSNSWHLLTGDLASIHRITDAIGFKYSYDAKKHLINHPTCTVLLSPSGKISSYTIGNEFPTKVVEANLLLAANDQVGQPADQSMMFGCIMLDPVTHKIRFVIENVLRAASVLTLIVLIFSIVSMTLKSKRADLLRNQGSGIGTPLV